jgi:hypothetical protein
MNKREKYVWDQMQTFLKASYKDKSDNWVCESRKEKDKLYLVFISVFGMTLV